MNLRSSDDRYRQGRSLDSETASTIGAVIGILGGIAIVAIAMAWAYLRSIGWLP